MCIRDRVNSRNLSDFFQVYCSKWSKTISNGNCCGDLSKRSSNSYMMFIWEENTISNTNCVECDCSTVSNISSFPEFSTLGVNVLTTFTNCNNRNFSRYCFPPYITRNTSDRIKLPIRNWIFSFN